MEPVFAPTLAADFKGVEEDSSRWSEIGGDGNPLLADPVLVAPTVKPKSRQTVDNDDKQQLQYDRMAIIQQYQEEAGLTEEAKEYLEHTVHSQTHRNYNVIWKNWVRWCRSKTTPINPLEYNPPQVLEFLVSNSGKSASYLNIIDRQSPLFSTSFTPKNHLFLRIHSFKGSLFLPED
ncbi:hypothetical protein Unana1_05848 [Umbelopsis nana]